MARILKRIALLLLAALLLLVLAAWWLLRGSLPAAIEQLEIARKAGDGDFYELSAVDARMRELKQRLLEEKRER